REGYPPAARTHHPGSGQPGSWWSAGVAPRVTTLRSKLKRPPAESRGPFYFSLSLWERAGVRGPSVGAQAFVLVGTPHPRFARPLQRERRMLRQRALTGARVVAPLRGQAAAAPRVRSGHPRSGPGRSTPKSAASTPAGYAGAHPAHDPGDRAQRQPRLVRASSPLDTARARARPGLPAATASRRRTRPANPGSRGRDAVR